MRLSSAVHAEPATAAHSEGDARISSARWASLIADGVLGHIERIAGAILDERAFRMLCDRYNPVNGGREPLVRGRRYR